MRRILATAAAALLAAGVLGAAGPVAAVPPTPPPAGAPSYYPSGPQYDVPVATLESAGWTRCFQEPYSNDGLTRISALEAACDGDYLILTGREIGTTTLDILAAAPRADVFTETTRNSPRLVNGAYWYFTTGWSMGFSTDGVINQDECDFDDGPVSGGLCWHMFYFSSGIPKLAKGYSLDGLNLNGGDNYYREVYSYGGEGVARGTFTISAGGSHSCAVSETGNAYCWGSNEQGQLGDGTTDDSEMSGPQLVIGGHAWASISAGENSTCGVTTSGDAYCWGSNYNGKLGDGTTADSEEDGPQLVIGGRDWSMVSVGYDHACGVTTSGDAYCWGDGTDAQLGTGEYEDSLEDGPRAVAGGIRWQSVTAGVLHSCGLSTSGQAYCWGSDYTYGFGGGQLGNGVDDGGSTIPQAVVGGHTFTTIDAGDWNTCAVTTSGDGYCWGVGDQGQMGDGNEEYRNDEPVLVAGELAWSYIDAGDDHTCGMTTSSAAYCWGSNYDGEAGIGTSDEGFLLTPQPVLGGVTFNQVVSNGFESGNHSCGIAMNYLAYCWGYNSSGQLGDGTVDDSAGLAIVSGGYSWKFLNFTGTSGTDPNCGDLDLTICPTITAGAKGLIGAPGTSHMLNRATYTWLRCSVPGSAETGPRAPTTCRTIRSFKATGAQMAVRPYGVTARDVRSGYIRLAVKVGTRTFYSGAYSVTP